MKDGSIKSVQRTEILLGKGGQGVVYLGTDEQGKYAIKINDFSKYDEMERDYRIECYTRELEML